MTTILADGVTNWPQAFSVTIIMVSFFAFAAFLLWKMP